MTFRVCPQSLKLPPCGHSVSCLAVVIDRSLWKNVPVMLQTMAVSNCLAERKQTEHHSFIMNKVLFCSLSFWSPICQNLNNSAYYHFDIQLHAYIHKHPSTYISKIQTDQSLKRHAQTKMLPSSDKNTRRCESKPADMADYTFRLIAASHDKEQVDMHMYISGLQNYVQDRFVLEVVQPSNLIRSWWNCLLTKSQMNQHWPIVVSSSISSLEATRISMQLLCQWNLPKILNVTFTVLLARFYLQPEC